MANHGFDGKEHERQAKVVVFVICGLCGFALGFIVPKDPANPWFYAEAVAGLILGALGGLWHTPDSDHDWKTMEEYRAERLLGWLGKLWNASIRVYSLAFKHRSLWTHSWRGTLLRMVPALVVLTALALLLRHLLQLDLRLLTPFYPTFALGWALQDMVHYRQDGLGWFGLSREDVYGRRYRR